MTNSMDMSLSELQELVTDGKPDVLQSMGLQKLDITAIELNSSFQRNTDLSLRLLLKDIEGGIIPQLKCGFSLWVYALSSGRQIELQLDMSISRKSRLYYEHLFALEQTDITLVGHTNLKLKFKYKCELSIFFLRLCGKGEKNESFSRVTTIQQSNYLKKIVYFNWLTFSKLKMLEQSFSFCVLKWFDSLLKKSLFFSQRLSTFCHLVSEILT